MSCRRIEVRNLAIGLADGSRRLVDGLDLVLEGGASLALVGESGAGKSMTSLAILDLLPRGVEKIDGSIVVNDRDIDALSAEELRQLRNREIGVIMQNPMSAFDPVFTVFSHFRDTVRAGGGDAGRGDVRRAALAALAEAGLSEPAAILDAYPFQLSGGMLQRVMIALALINDPQYLIADEPTTDLDVLSQKKVLDLLRERCADRHVGLLLVTHDLGVAAYMAETIAVMHRGRIVEMGGADAILGGAEHPYVRKLAAAYRQLHGDRFRRMTDAFAAGREPS